MRLPLHVPFGSGRQVQPMLSTVPLQKVRMCLKSRAKKGLTDSRPQPIWEGGLNRPICAIRFLGIPGDTILLSKVRTGGRKVRAL